MGRAVALVSLGWLCCGAGGLSWSIPSGHVPTVPEVLRGVAVAWGGFPACLCLPPSSALASPHAQQGRGGLSPPSATGGSGVPCKCSAQPSGEPGRVLKGTLLLQLSQQVNEEAKTLTVNFSVIR